MSNTFNSGVQIPNLVNETPTPAEAGLVKLFGRNGRLYGILPDGTEVTLSNSVFQAGTGTPVPADFPDRQTIVIKGEPARLYLLDDIGGVREIYNSDQTNFLYWKAAPGTQAGRQTVAQTAPVNPSEGDIWYRVQ